MFALSKTIRFDSFSNRLHSLDKWRLATAMFALVYWLGLSLLHLKFSMLFVIPRATPLGEIRLSSYSKPGAMVLVIGLSLFIAYRAFKGRQRVKTLVYWFLIAVMVRASDRFLIVTVNEYIHFSQYAILAILMSRVLDPGAKNAPIGKILFWTTVMGVVDEMIQYFLIAPSYGMYLDFNDFILNEVGAAAGLLIIYGFKAPGGERTGGGREKLRAFFRSREFTFVVVCCVLVLFCLATGRLSVTPTDKIPPGGIVKENGCVKIYLQREQGVMGSWRKSPRGGYFYALPPSLGLFLLIAGWMIFASMEIALRRNTVYI